LNRLIRTLAVALTAGAVSLGSAAAVSGAPKPQQTPQATPSLLTAPSPSSSASPAPLPTATPEPLDIAIPRLEAKVKANPNDRASLTELAGYYLSAGRPDKGIGITQHLLELGEKTAQVYYLDGIANQSLGRIKEATADFEEAANREPTNSQVLLTLTSLYMQTNRLPDAERVAKRATTFNPNDKQAFMNYGLVLAQEKKYDEARAAFEKAGSIDPKDPQPVVLQARSYIDQNAFALALQLFDRAIAIDPKDGEAVLGKARLLAAEHNVKDSIATYEALLPLLKTPESKAAVVIEEFRVYQTEKLDPESDATIKRALADYGSVPGVHVAYGDYLLTRKDQAGAEREWKVALGDKRENPDALQRLADLSLSQNKLGPATDYFVRLSQVSPNDPAVFGELGQVQSFGGHFDKSRDAYRRAFEISRSPQALAGMGAADVQLRNFKECGQIFDAIDKGAPDLEKQNPQVLYIMGRCYAGGNQRDKARTAYSRFMAFLKPGSPAVKDVQKLIAALGSHPAPAATAKPKTSGH
jgi:tetratricopeptide (TPR) repeat protein